MTHTSHRESARRAGSVATTLLVLVSLGLNAFLVAQLLHRRPSLPAQAASAPGTQARPTRTNLQAVQAGASSATPLSAVTNTAPPFRWSQIESADYRQYIANLRAVGCPEQVIRDIIMADLNQAFAPRAREILKFEVREYWQKPKREQPNAEQEKQLVALSKDKAAVVQDLLGVHVEEQQLINTVLLQVYGTEQNLLFLPADKREAAMQALADADFETKAQERRERAGHSNETDKQILNDALKLLAGVLTPAELDEYRLRASPTANSLRTELQYFNCTPDEFRQLVDSREAAAGAALGNLGDRTAATAEVRKLFGDDRAAEFERVTDMYYINARRLAENFNLPAESADQVWQISRDVREAVAALAKNTALAADEQRRQTEALMKPVQARLNELLGKKAARSIVRDLRVGSNLSPTE